jgi:HEAT repeat protein
MKIVDSFKPVILILLLISSAGAVMPRGAEKEKVRSVIREVESLSVKYKTLDEFGRNTMLQGKELLAIGPSAVYTLSNCLNSPDWRVRFWIADILGYLDNEDAKRPLLRLINDSNEDMRVRNKAVESLKRLETPIERNIQ